MKDLYGLVEAVIDAAEPPEHITAEQRTSSGVLPLALLGRAGRLLRGLLHLHQDGLLSCGGDVLARSVFETATYAVWVIGKPDRTKDIIRDGNRSLRLLAMSGDETDIALYEDAMRRWDEAYPGEEAHARGPSFEQILSECHEPLPSWYPTYRRLSGLLHPGSKTVDVEYTLDANAGLERNPLHHDPLGGTLLAFSAIQVWNVVMRLHAESDAIPERALAALGPLLNDLLLAGQG